MWRSSFAAEGKAISEFRGEGKGFESLHWAWNWFLLFFSASRYFRYGLNQKRARFFSKATQKTEKTANSEKAVLQRLSLWAKMVITSKTRPNLVLTQKCLIAHISKANLTRISVWCLFPTFDARWPSDIVGWGGEIPLAKELRSQTHHNGETMESNR